MSGKNNLIAWLLAGGVSIGAVAGGGYYASQQDNSNPAAIASIGTETPKVETSPQPVETKGAEPEKPAEIATPNPDMPKFDILRVEKDGSAVVAGSAKPGSTVELMSGGNVVATAKAGPGGDFAIVLDTPLGKGGHELTLKATDATGASMVSEEAGIVTIPDEEGELLAMVSKPGEASLILQKGDAPAVTAGQAAPAQVAVVTPVPEATAPAAVEVAPVAPAPEKPVLVSAVDFEAGRIYVAGSGEAGRTVNIYIDEALAGTTKIGADGNFLMESAATLSAGSHTIRADMLAADGAQVAARSQVPLLHEVEAPAQVAAVQPAEPAKPVETATATAEPAKPADTATAPAEPAKPVETATATTEPAKPVEEAQPAQESKPAEVAVDSSPAVQEPIKTGASVIIRRGDNLWRVSRRMLGKGIRYTVIYEANKGQISDPGLIFPGQVFNVPGGNG